MIFDHSPFDGVPDGVSEEFLNTLFLNVPLGEARAAIEFDLSNVNPHRIESAVLTIVSHGEGTLPDTLTIPVQVFGYDADDSIQNDDFNAGSLVTTFDALATPDNVPISLDVTSFFETHRQLNILS